MGLGLPGVEQIDGEAEKVTSVSSDKGEVVDCRSSRKVCVKNWSRAASGKLSPDGGNFAINGEDSTGEAGFNLSDPDKQCVRPGGVLDTFFCRPLLKFAEGENAEKELGGSTRTDEG